MRTVKQCLVVIVLGLCSSSVWAFGLERFVEGVHYKKIDSAEYQAKSVVEFFSFGCPHCYHLEPLMEEWLKAKPADVSFSRVPATWNQNFVVLGKLYYVTQALGIEEKAVPAIFDYLHKQGKKIEGRSDAEALLAGLGVSKEDFDKTWADEKLDSKVTAAGRQFVALQIRGVPAIVVNGQYQTGVQMAGSPKEMFEVVNFLLTK